MEVRKLSLIDFIKTNAQFIIPIYQRSYKWEEKHCKKLWEDIKYAAENNSIKEHFLGSIVTVSHKSDMVAKSRKMVVDGQQRLTTLMLLIAALIQKLDDSFAVNIIKDDYLINRNSEGDSKYKMLLTRSDKQSLINIIEGEEEKFIMSERMKKNFNFFQESVEKENPKSIEYDGIRKLTVIDILLNPSKDNPQLIFESLNSTGLDLSNADLIRNYVLMGLRDEKQKAIYSKHWQPMEEGFGQENTDLFDEFIRHYLTMEMWEDLNLSQPVKKKDVYEEFKKYYRNSGGSKKVETIVGKIHTYAQHYANIVLDSEENKKLRQAFADLNELKATVTYPFLLPVYNDYIDRVIDESCFLKILSLVESYLFRRSVTNERTSGLNKIFPGLYREINKKEYLESFKATLLLMDTANSRFPKNEKFKNELREKDLYNLRSKRNYWLRKLENYGRKEPVNISDYSVEHIMPQNSDLPKRWRDELGDDWAAVQERLLHTLGNLTLTGANSELGDRSFKEKKTIEHGFDESPLRLNQTLKNVEKWDEQAIEERTKTLSEKMIEIWPYPKLSREILEKYKKEPEYTITNFPLLSEGALKEVFTAFREKIKNLDYGVKEEFLKNHIAYKFEGNFTCIVPIKSELRLYLNIKHKEINDPKQWSKDCKDKGRWATGETMFPISSLEELDYAMRLVKQAFDKHIEE